MRKIERKLKENKRTYQAAKQIKLGVHGRINGLIKLVIEILRFNKGKRETEQELLKLTEQNNIYLPQNERVHSKFYLPLVCKERGLDSDAIQYCIFALDNYYEFDELEYVKSKKYINNNATILDIGANIGNHTLYFANECEANHIYAFEPVEKTFSYLKKNVQINGLEERVDLFNCGVGEKSGKAAIESFDEKNIGATTLSLNNVGDIPIVAIDDLVLNINIDFVKIDTEGFEISVIKGMGTLLKVCRPNIWVEASEDNLRIILELLNEIGYKKVENLGTNDYILSVL
jgi:FkbM family methyltransferase